MPRRPGTVFLIFIVLCAACSIAFAAPPVRMRPYSGIGLIVFSHSETDSAQELQLPLYEEPGLSRVGVLNNTKSSGNEWIFGQQESHIPLVVSARKGEWLRVYYDDAGREAWLDPQHKGHFKTWEQFLKQQSTRMLPGLSPRYYQLQQQPGGKVLATLTPKLPFKVLKLDNTWGMVLIDQGQIGWLRWQDDDGRVTVTTGKSQN